MMLIEKLPRNVRLTIDPYEQCPCGSKKVSNFAVNQNRPNINTIGRSIVNILISAKSMNL